jgi:hypothetical protein
MMDDFKTMKEITQRVFKTPEDEEFERIQIEMEQRGEQGLRKRAYETAEEAFAAWDRVSHQPNQHELQKQAFNAGWDAAMKKRWSEQND